jgi:hypothetical protein
MTPKLFEPSRRVLLAAAAAVGASSALQSVARASSDYFAADAIRPFRIEISEDALADLRSRIARTRWPERETVADQSQGVQLATLQKLAAYWATDYDWREIETRLNALPQFITEIDGLDIHFIDVRSVQPNALPSIVTHGWPGSIIEQLKIVGRLRIQSLMVAVRRSPRSSLRGSLPGQTSLQINNLPLSVLLRPASILAARPRAKFFLAASRASVAIVSRHRV